MIEPTALEATAALVRALKALGDPTRLRVEVWSAGTEKTGVKPEAVAVMAEAGIDLAAWHGVRDGLGRMSRRLVDGPRAGRVPSDDELAAARTGEGQRLSGARRRRHAGRPRGCVAWGVEPVRPPHATAGATPPAAALERLLELLRGRRALVLSGAGLSTESGIPDYRGPDGERRAAHPMTYQEFARSADARRRYWARSYLGWPAMRAKHPNAGHRAVAGLEAAGYVGGVLTQNVDGLHQAAGSRTVLELHGALARVRCLACGGEEARDEVQRRLARANPGFAASRAELAPDGDARLAPELERAFEPVACRLCGGVLKPDVVFFGENVTRATLERSWAMLDDAEVLLVLGSSLTVRSGYRYVVAARTRGTPVAIVNDGVTRGDEDADVRVGGRLGAVLPALVAGLLASG